MSETHRPLSALRSIGAVLAGFVAIVVLSIGTDVLMNKAGIFPAPGEPMGDGLLMLP